jgi:very-short-patch-repair endonuclease
VKKSSLEKEFALIAKEFKLPPYVTEYRFHNIRKFRFDVAFLDKKVAVEVEGGVYRGARGRHTSGVGFTNDCTKLNLATEMGWAILRYTGEQMKQDPKGMIDQIKEVLKMRKKGGG